MTIETELAKALETRRFIVLAEAQARLDAGGDPIAAYGHLISLVYDTKNLFMLTGMRLDLWQFLGDELIAFYEVTEVEELAALPAAAERLIEAVDAVLLVFAGSGSRPVAELAMLLENPLEDAER